MNRKMGEKAPEMNRQKPLVHTINVPPEIHNNSQLVYYRTTWDQNKGPIPSQKHPEWSLMLATKKPLRAIPTWGKNVPFSPAQMFYSMQLLAIAINSLG